MQDEDRVHVRERTYFRRGKQACARGSRIRSMWGQRELSCLHQAGTKAWIGEYVIPRHTARHCGGQMGLTSLCVSGLWHYHPRRTRISSCYSFCFCGKFSPGKVGEGLRGGSSPSMGRRWANFSFACGRTPSQVATVKSRTRVFSASNRLDLFAGQVLAIGMNYASHAVEMMKPVPECPIVFSKGLNTMVADGEPIRIPRNEPKVCRMSVGMS